MFYPDMRVPPGDRKSGEVKTYKLPKEEIEKIFNNVKKEKTPTMMKATTVGLADYHIKNRK